MLSTTAPQKMKEKKQNTGPRKGATVLSAAKTGSSLSSSGRKPLWKAPAACGGPRPSRHHSHAIRDPGGRRPSRVDVRRGMMGDKGSRHGCACGDGEAMLRDNVTGAEGARA